MSDCGNITLLIKHGNKTWAVWKEWDDVRTGEKQGELDVLEAIWKEIQATNTIMHDEYYEYYEVNGVKYARQKGEEMKNYTKLEIQKRTRDRRSGKLAPFVKMTDEEKKAKRKLRYLKERSDPEIVEKHRVSERKSHKKSQRNSQEYRDMKNKAAKEWYLEHKDDPGFKEKKKKATGKWYEEHKDDPGFIEAHRKDCRERYRKHKDDPEYKERVLRASKKQRDKIMSDPVLLKERRALGRKASKKWYEEHKDDPEFREANRIRSQKVRDKKKAEEQE